MQANDCKPLAIERASPPSLQVDENTPVSSIVPCASVTPEAERSVTPGQAMAIEAKTRGQPERSLRYEERQWRIMASFFGYVCKRRPSTSPFSLVNSITNQLAYQLIFSCVLGGKTMKTKQSVPTCSQCKKIDILVSKLHLLGLSSIMNMLGWVRVQMDWSPIPILQTLMACWRSNAHISSETVPHLKQPLNKDFVVNLKIALPHKDMKQM